MNTQTTARLQITSSALFLFLLLILQLITPNYTLQNNVISDLGINPYSANLFNPLLIIAGLTIVLIAILHANNLRDFIFSISLLTSGFGFAIAGYYPKNTYVPHVIGAALAFLAAIFAIFYACKLASGLYQRIFALLGTISLVAVVVFSNYITNSIVENLIIIPFLLWNILFGFYLLKNQNLS